jgi:hypothetical protein
MPLLTPQQYVQARQAYCYNSPDCNFSIVQTGKLTNIGSFVGIFATNVPPIYPNGINLRRFEAICQEVFNDCPNAIQSNTFTNNHLNNLRNISAAIVYWKMSSQGGRASLKVKNMLKQWQNTTANQLIGAYQNKQMSQFRIGGIRIPTATAFMRFLFPNDFGIMDSRVVRKYTQPKGITTLSVRNNGYINDTGANVRKYNTQYIPYLRSEAKWLNNQGVTFQDTDVFGKVFNSLFRACDIEMALF